MRSGERKVRERESAGVRMGVAWGIRVKGDKQEGCSLETRRRDPICTIYLGGV